MASCVRCERTTMEGAGQHNGSEQRRHFVTEQAIPIAICCDTAKCVANGNAAKEIRVWGEPSFEFQIYEIKCPWCGEMIQRRLKLAKVVMVGQSPLTG